MDEKRALNEGLRNAAAEHANKMRDAVVSKIRTTMNLIDQEISSSYGVYPENGGRLGQRELCRRAGIHHQTLQQPAHRDTTRLEVSDWLSLKEIKTKNATKKAISGKVDYWKDQHQMVATQIAVYELELNERDVEIRNLKSANKKNFMDKEDEINRLKAENWALREALTAAQKGKNVTPLRPKKQ